MTILGIPAPNLPLGNREAVVNFNLTEPGASRVRVWCIEAPASSELDRRLKEDSASRTRIEVYFGDGGPNDPWRHRFDKGGKYTLIAQEYQGLSDWGGGYQGDPKAYP